MTSRVVFVPPGDTGQIVRLFPRTSQALVDFDGEPVEPRLLDGTDELRSLAGCRLLVHADDVQVVS